MKDHLSTNQIVLITKTFILENFIYENFIIRKFCQILFDFISFLFNFKIFIFFFEFFFVMNSVHEPGSRTMSKNLTPKKYRVKLGQKQAKCTKCTALASPRLPRSRCAPRPPRARLLRSTRPCPARLAACRARQRAPRSPSAQPS